MGQTVPRQRQTGNSFLNRDIDSGFTSPKGFTGYAFEMTMLSFHKKIKFHSRDMVVSFRGMDIQNQVSDAWKILFMKHYIP